MSSIQKNPKAIFNNMYLLNLNNSLYELGHETYTSFYLTYKFDLLIR